MAIFFFVCRDRAQFQEEGKSGCREKFKTNLFWVWSTPVLKTIWAPLRGNTDLQKQNRAQKSYCSISLTNKKAKWNVKAVYLWFLQTWGPRIESRSFFRFFLNNRHIDMTHKHKNVYETCQTWEKNIWKIGIWTRVALLWSRALACTAILSQSFGRKITGYIKEKAMIYWFYAYDAKRHCK